MVKRCMARRMLSSLTPDIDYPKAGARALRESLGAAGVAPAPNAARGGFPIAVASAVFVGNDFMHTYWLYPNAHIFWLSILKF
jgi:hypothetical protein